MIHAHEMTDPDRLVGDHRCWPCTLANAAAAAVVAGVPLLAALLSGDPVLVGATVVWTALVFGYTGYRLLILGYLPGSETVAKATGLHDRIGPETSDSADETQDWNDNDEL